MGRRTPGRRVPPRGPGGRRVPPPPPGRPEPRTTPSLGAIGPAVMAAAKDKGMVEGRGIAPRPGSFESMLNRLEQQKKEAQAKTGSSALSPKQIAETMVDERAKSGTPFDMDSFKSLAEELQRRKEEKRSGSENVDSPFNQERFEKFKAGFRPKTDSGDTSSLAGLTKENPPEFDGDAFRAKLEELQRRKEVERAGPYSDAFRADLTKKINDEIKREEQIKAEKTGITKEGRSEFNYDAFKAKLEEIQRRKEEGKPVFKGIRGGPRRPVRRTGGKPRTFRRTGGRPAPFFSPRPTRPPVRYGIGGPFGTRPFFGGRPSRPAPFFSPSPTRPTYAMGRLFGVPFGMRR